MKIDLALLKKIHDNISKESTGCPECFAKKLGTSKRFLYEVFEYLKVEFNAPIVYSRSRETYYYSEEWEFYIGDLRLVRSQLIKELILKLHNTLKLAIILDLLIF